MNLTNLLLLLIVLAILVPALGGLSLAYYSPIGILVVVLIVVLVVNNRPV